jgi:hypothetical protein
MRIIKLTESDLEQIIKKVISEQVPKSSASKTNQQVASSTLKLPKTFQCMNEELSAAAQFAISQGASPFFVKFGLGILARESDFGEVMGKYGIKAGPEYVMNKMSEIVPGFKSLLQFGAKIVFDKDNWVPSMGIAQMTPDIAKKYNVNLEDLMSLSGSLLAVSKHLTDLYQETSKFYDANQPSTIIIDGKLSNNPSSSGNAALDSAIMAYNLGSSRFRKQYCKTNNPQFMAPCNSPNGVYLPYPKDNPNMKLTVDKNSVIKNYTPTLRTDTTKLTQKTLNKYFRDTPQNTQYISNLGYLKEVVGVAKTFGCIR